MKMNRTKYAFVVSLALLAAAVVAPAQSLINVRVAGGAPGTPTGAAVIGTAGNTWNYFPSLAGRASGGGVVTNATVIKDSANATLASVTMTMSLSGGDDLDNFTDGSSFNPTPSLLMANYIYENAGANYFTFTFSNLPASKTYLIYGMGNGNATGQGTTWWADVANGHATNSASANFSLGDRNATLASNEGICWMKIPATTTASGALTFRVVRLGAAEDGTGGSGRAYLNAFQLLPLSAPVISNLTNRTVVAGTSPVLSPSVTGVPTPSFQWRSNSVAIAGATNSSLTLNNVQYTANGAAYSLIASNLVGKVTNSMTLTVIVTPSITGLNNQAVAVGTDVTNAPTVSGVPTPSARWQFNGGNLSDGATGNGSTISGSTTTSLIIANAQAADSGSYSLIATNTAGFVTNSMTLTVSSGDVAPNITGPTDQTLVQGSNATFTASVSGLPLPTLQWLANGTNVPGATSSSLIVSNVQYSQNGHAYSLVASNSAGQATNSATLFVLVPPAISQQPTNLAVTVSSPAVFSVTASGVPAVKYQWRKNGSPIANATNATYTISSPQGADNGAVFSVVVSNSVNVVTSSNATLTVLSALTGTFLPTNNATGISPDQQLRIVFPSAIKLGTNGVITIRDAANNSVFATINASQFLSYTPGNTSIQTIPNAALRSVQGAGYYYMPITIYDNEVWITFTNRFAYNKTYYVNMDAGLLLDTNSAAIAGVAGTNTWRFSTKVSGPATPTTSTGPTTITIGQDGIADFATFQGAFDWVPQNNTLVRTIRVKTGLYRDNATLAQNRNFVTIVGEGASRTNAQLIYPFAFFGPPNTVFTSGSLRIESSDVTVLNLTLDNIIYKEFHPTGETTSGAPGAFAGAINTLATKGRRIVFENVLIKGGQDTVYHDSSTGVVYFHNCEVWGSVDYIYGNSLGVYDQCTIVEIRSTGGPITAPNTVSAQPYGLVFLGCTFPRALVANGYPYDVATGNTTFQRPWGKDGMTAIINCAVGSQFSTKGWLEWGNRHTTCRAREAGTTLIGGGSVTPSQRQAAGGYWLNTIDQDYVSNPAIDPDVDPSLLLPPGGTNNRVDVVVNVSDYTLAAIFGHAYFNLSGWVPTVPPAITVQPTNKTVSAGSPASFNVVAVALPAPTYQWRKSGTNISGATNVTFTLSSTTVADNAAYSVTVSNSAGSVTSSNAVLTVPAVAAPITPTFTNGVLSLSWPANQTGFRLEVQTNNLVTGLGTNWFTLAGSTATNQTTLPLDPANGSVFFRLVFP